DVTEFNQDDFKLLEKTLQRCIQYIRFHEISMPDFYHKVLPYRRISQSYTSYAMYCNRNTGPNFGSDLYINGNNLYNGCNGYYPSVGVPNGSQIKEYEVFQ
ncbi:12195_t:CDS:2, partial [Racocetra fulgida]